MKNRQNVHLKVLNNIVSDQCRVFGAVLITARNVTYALNSAPDASQAYESGRKMLSLMQDRHVEQEQERQVKLFFHHKLHTKLMNV